jgi:hypothetical protein
MGAPVVMKEINIFLLCMTAALPAFAGEEGIDVASIGNTAPVQLKNSVRPPVVTEKNTIPSQTGR